jgi:hypothetical protein
MPPVHFALVILEMKSHELFARLASNLSPPDLNLPSRIIGVLLVFQSEV